VHNPSQEPRKPRDAAQGRASQNVPILVGIGVRAKEYFCARAGDQLGPRISVGVIPNRADFSAA
jgi:hypothetical protein